MKNRGGLNHLDHEGGETAREIVTCADAGENPVDRTDTGVLRRNPGAGKREYHDQCDAAHIGRLAAHIGAGNHEKPPPGFKRAVVCHIVLQRLFNNGVPGPFDCESRGVRELGTRPLHIGRVLSEREEGVKRRRGF